MRCHNHENRLAAEVLRYCGKCISDDVSISSQAEEVHTGFRSKVGLVPRIPANGKIVCPDCGNHCRLSLGEIGYCNNRVASEEGIIHRYGNAVPVSWYFDPLPTNCVADWVCPVDKRENMRTGQGRLRNLAVFYGSCSSDCLFCQNSSYKEMMRTGKPRMTPEELADCADELTACVCYFGGDPSCNPQHSLLASEILFERYDIPVCYETNGNISSKWLYKIADIVQLSRGTLKFDLKAVTATLYRALVGTQNSVVLRNFRKLAQREKKREGTFLVASVLLIPGYIDLKEIRRLCEFIARCDSTIPTTLLGFAPRHYMSDLPRTSRSHAKAALAIAEESGLEKVRLGNAHLLSDVEYWYG